MLTNQGWSDGLIIGQAAIFQPTQSKESDVDIVALPVLLSTILFFLVQAIAS